VHETTKFRHSIHIPNMKVAFLSDVHANKPALDAVLEDMPAVDAIVCLGDIVGYGPHPQECAETIRDVADVVIQGNHDREFTDPEAYTSNEMAQAGLQHAKAELSESEASWLQSLPAQTTAFPNADGDDRGYFVHSHPGTLDKYTRPREFTAVSTFMDDHHAVLALGHTHIQHAVDMSKYDRHGIVLNPGSVGQPRDEDWRAAYGVVDFSQQSVALHRVEYPVAQVQREVHAAGLPGKTASRLADGK